MCLVSLEAGPILTSQRKQETAADYYEGFFPKAKSRCQLFSWHALLYAGLLEGDPEIAHYRPRGRRLTYRYRGRQQIYQPTFVVTGRGSGTRLVTIKPAAEIAQRPWPWLPCVTAHCTEHHEHFHPVAHEDIEANACLAFNWIQITRYIVGLRESALDTEVAVEQARQVLARGGQTYDTLLDSLPAADAAARAAIPFVLLHRGHADCPALATEPLHGAMMLWPL